MIHWFSFGQESDYKKVLLTDGSVLQGEIIEDTDFYIKMIIATGDTVTIGYKNILQSGLSGRLTRQKKPKYHKTDGLYVTLGLMPQTATQNSEGDYGFEFKVGKRLNANWQTGLQVNYSLYSTFTSFAFFRPGYLTIGPEIRKYWTSRVDKVRWYSSASVGIGIPVHNSRFIIDEQHNMGITANFSTGIHLASRKKVRFLMEGGVRYLRVEGSGLGRQTFVGGFDQPIIEYKNNYVRPFLGFFVEF